VLPAPGARLHRHALAWHAAAIGFSGAAAFVCDAEQAIIAADGRPERLVPQLRQVVDYDTLLEANPFGETVAVARSAYVAAADEPTTTTVEAARGSLLLALAA